MASSGPTTSTLDIMPVLKSETPAAMSVKVTDCIFAKNELFWSHCQHWRFIELGSEMTENTNNFSVGITAGGYEGGGSCSDIFLEGQGDACLGPTSCSGNCAKFSVTTCSVDAISQDGGNNTEKGTPSVTASPADESRSPHTYTAKARHRDHRRSFAVFGLVSGILLRRGNVPLLMRRPKNSNKASSNSNDSGDAEGSRGGVGKD